MKNHSDKKQDEARDAGCAARREGKGKDACPYLYVLLLRSAWLIGWEQENRIFNADAAKRGER